MGGHSVLVVLLCSVVAAVDNKPPGSRPSLPFRYLHACSDHNLTTTTIPNTTIIPTTTPTPHKNSTILLFYHAQAPSSSSSSSSSCQCEVRSHSQLYLTRLGIPGATNITIAQRNTTTSLDTECQQQPTGASPTTGCLWSGSTDDDSSLNITMMTSDGERKRADKEPDGGEGGGREKERGKEGGGDFVILVVQGEGDVQIECREVTITDQPATAPTGSNTTTNTTQSNNGSSIPSHSPTPSGNNNNDTNNTSTTTSPFTKPSSPGGDNMTGVIIVATPRDTKKTVTPGLGGSGSGDPPGHHAGRDRHGRQEDSDHGFPVLWVGVGLIAASLVIVVAVVLTHYRRRRRKSIDVENALPSNKRRKRTANTPPTTTTKGGGKSGGEAAGSRDSLLNENHNYEEVSDDGLGEVSLVHVQRGDRKASSPSVPPNTYSHIKVAASAGDPATAPNPSSQQQPRRPTNTTHHTADASSENSDNYNRLDLARAARLNSRDDKASSPKTFYAAEDDDEYMAVNDDGPDAADDDGAGSDIYEAVDGDPERTPLCPRRGTESRSEYTDCISGEDGKFRVCEGRGKGAGGDNSKGPFPLHIPRLSNPTSDKGENPPTLPTSPPPLRGAGQGHGQDQGHGQGHGHGQGRGLNRNNSRSVDQLVREKFQRTRVQHSHSRSMDLNNHHDLCQQRELFLKNFRSQGDGAENTEPPPPPDNEEYSNISVTRPPQHDPPPASDTSHPKTPGASHPRPQPPATAPASSQNSGDGSEPVLMRRKSRPSSKKKKVGGAGGGGVEGQLTMVDHLKELNTGLLELESAVRHSMEIKDEELVMVDNIIYGTLPRNLSLPTTEL